MAVYKRHVLGCNATTNAPFSTPSPFLCTHRPNRVSCPMPATSNTVLTCCARPVFPDASASGCRAHSALSANSGGGVQKCSEFTTPVAATVPTSANDLSFASSFQSRIEPSQEPMCVSVSWYMACGGRGERDYRPEAKRSEYDNAPMAVTQRGLRIVGMSSVSMCDSSSPCASACVNTGFFFCVVQSAMDLS